jgi:hypothetical protein
MLAAIEAHVDPVMDEAFTLQALSNACFDHHVHGALFEHARANAVFDVMPAAHFYNDGFDPLQVKQVRQQQSRGTRSDNSDLRAQRVPFEGRQMGEGR